MIERPYRAIIVAHADRIATLTFNRPERRNPLGPEMVNELLWALEDAARDPEVRVVVLTGAGNTFSAGADLKQMSGGSESAPELPSKGDYSDLLGGLLHYTKPTIARVLGPALGGGLGLVAACHFAVGGESAILGTPEVKRGLWPMMIMTALRRIVPERKLFSMMMLGEKLSARQAYEHGLLSEVVPDEQLDGRIEELAHILADRSPTAIRLGLEAFHATGQLPLEAALPDLRDRLYTMLGTEDAREGLSAFFEKREPRFTGR